MDELQETKKEKWITRSLLFGPLVILALFITVQMVHFPSNSDVTVATNDTTQTASSSELQTIHDEILTTSKNYKKINLIARAAVVQNLRTKEVLYAKNLNDQLPLASLTKLMTAVVAEEKIGNTTLVQITPEDVAVEGSDTLVEGESLSAGDLIDFMLVGSSNDGASALASVAGASIQQEAPQSRGKSVFIAEMNQTAQNIGLSNTHFYNETGLDQRGRAGAYGSVRDIATLFDYILENHPHLAEATKENVIYVNSTTGLQHAVHNTNQIVGELPNLVASKTGYTEEAGGNLAVVVDAGLNDPVVLVVLGSTFDGRFEDIKKLANEFVSKKLTE